MNLQIFDLFLLMQRAQFQVGAACHNLDTGSITCSKSQVTLIQCKQNLQEIMNTILVKTKNNKILHSTIPEYNKLHSKRLDSSSSQENFEEQNANGPFGIIRV